MTDPGATHVESALSRILLPLCLASGAVVIAGFFFPDIAGEFVSDETWLVFALTFFGAGLGYLALLPDPIPDREEQTDPGDPGYYLKIRRMGAQGALRNFLRKQDPMTFWIPLVALFLFFIAQFIVPGTILSDLATDVEALLLEDLGWIFLIAIALAVLFCIIVLLGPWGEVKLGGEDAEPAYTYPMYFTLFFTAGIAAGIVFWGPAEALFHYDNPPPFVDAAAHSDEAVTGALMYSLFHWGFSAWASYLVLGIPIAYYVYNRGAPLRVSTILVPFVGTEGLSRPIARVVDVFAIFATIGGIATSVALVAQQFLTGVQFQWDVVTGSLGPVLFVAGLTAIFVISAQSGVHRGIRRLANVNIVLFVLFGALILLLGPRSFILGEGGAAASDYAVNFIPLSFEFGDQWVADWTVWNWVWWFSWAPFAGLFLAALSRGRRLRSVVLTGFVATALATIVWFILLGGTALEFQHNAGVDILGAMAAVDSAADVAAFPILDALALSDLLIFLLLALIIVFIATSADTSTLVVSILSTRLGNAPTTATIVFWGLFQGLVAMAVLVTDTEAALQTAAVLLGGPIAIIALIALAGFSLEFLRNERGHQSIISQFWHKLDPFEDEDTEL